MATTIKPLKVLVDRSVRVDAVRAEAAFHLVEGEMFGKTYRYLEPLLKKKSPRSDWREQEIRCLPRIAEMIRQGQIKAYTTGELDAEALRVEEFLSLDCADFFEGCDFEELPAPLERSKWGLGVDEFLDRDEVIAYCNSFLLTPCNERIEHFIIGMQANPRFSLTSFEERCLRRVDVFKSICRGIHPNHYPDALHLWTAEESGIDVFLTHDAKFRNVMFFQKIQLNCQICFHQILNGGLQLPQHNSTVCLTRSSLILVRRHPIRCRVEGGQEVGGGDAACALSE